MNISDEMVEAAAKHYVTRNSIAEGKSYRCWLSCRCGWVGANLPDGNIPTTHRGKVSHYLTAALGSVPAPEDDERTPEKHFADLIYERGLRAPDSTLAVLAFKEVLAARRSPVPAGTPSEDGYPEPHPAFPEGFASSHMRAILVDAYDRGVTSRPTPPEDVAEGRIPDLIQALSNYDAVNDDAVEEAVLAALDEVGIALAAVPTDGETETTIAVQVLCRDGVWRDTNWPSLAEARAEMPGAQANFRAVRVMVTPIPESEEQR